MEGQKRFGLGVFVCVFNKGVSKILLLKRNKDKRKQWGADWGNVGGRIEFGETSVDACIREAEEEIGVTFHPSDLTLIQVKESPHFLPYIHAIHFVYATTVDENSSIFLNAKAKTKESDSYQWFDLDNLPKRTLDPSSDLLKWASLARERFARI